MKIISFSMKPKEIHYNFAAHSQKGVPVVPISMPCLDFQELNKIQQIDVSMHLLHYSGSAKPSAGCVALVRENGSASSRYIPVIFLSRARRIEESLEDFCLLLSTGQTLEEFRPWFVSKPYPVEMILRILHQV